VSNGWHAAENKLSQPVSEVSPNRIRSGLNTAYVVGLARVERTVPFWPIEWIERRQRDRLRSIVNLAYQAVPFYQEAMRERGLQPSDFRAVSDLAELPLIDGALVQENLEQFLVKGANRETWSTFHTSGSTSGVRRTVYWDRGSMLRGLAYVERIWPVLSKLAGEPRSRAVMRALLGETRAQALLAKLGRQTRMLFISQNELRTRMLVPPVDRGIWRPQTAVNYHFLSTLEPMEVVADRMNVIRPRMVFSFGSYADQFLRFLANRGGRVALPRVWSYTGDTVSAGSRELAEEQFGCAVHSSYNVTEVGRIGFQCERREGHHLNVDLCAVRLVGDRGESVGPGQHGEVVVSSLRNRALVLLNYRLGDSGMLASERCPCGRSLPLLERLEGRRSDVVRLADGREIASLALEALFRRELQSALKVQIAQPGPGEIAWRIVPFSGVDRDALRAGLVRRAAEVLGQPNRVTVEFVDDIPATSEGKFTKVVSPRSDAAS
jgi:phenylacetate-coenzyme A ligase PaaK-like adenylate-forming protein